MSRTTSLLAFLVLAPGALWGQYVVSPYRDFSGGLNDNTPAISLPANESPRLFNVVLDDPVGALKTRGGMALCGNLPSGNFPTMLCNFSQSDGTERLIVSDNQNFYQTADCRTYTTLKTGQSSTSQPYCKMVRDKMWVVNRATHPWTWNGISSSTLDGGTNTPSPPPPKFRYIEFWKERVWGANDMLNPSGVYFSALTDSSGGSIDPSTGSASWPAINLIQVDQNGGSPIYGIKSCGDALCVWKDNGVWKIFFENEFNVSVVKLRAVPGSRFQTAIVENEGVIYYVGVDGFYAFDGEQAVRISQNIFNLFDSIQQPKVNIKFKVWTSNSDFDAGSPKVQVDTGSVTGALLAGTTVQAQSNFNDVSDGVKAAGSTFASQGRVWTVGGNGVRAVNGYIQANVAAGIFRISTPYSEPNFNQQQGRRYSSRQVVYSGADNMSDTFFMTDSLTGVSNGYSLYLHGSAGYLRIRRWTGGVSTDILNLDAYYPGSDAWHDYDVDISSVGKMSVKVNGVLKGAVTDTTYSSSIGFLWYGDFAATNGAAFDNFKDRIYYTTSTHISDIHDAVSVSSWTALDVGYSANGITSNFSVRVGSNTGGVQSSTFSLITPGSLIPGATWQTQVQWMVQTVADSLNYAEINDVTANWTSGGTPGQSIYGAAAKNRIYFSASTGTAAQNNLVVVKQKIQGVSWVPYTWQLGPMVLFNDNFYGGASTHSAIYRLDYGTSDNGKNIEMSWESRDDIMGMPSVNKTLQELYLDYEKVTAPSTFLAWSRDSGVTFSTRAVAMTGTGRGGYRGLMNGGTALQFRYRVSNGGLDEPIKVYGLESYSIPGKARFSQ